MKPTYKALGALAFTATLAGCIDEPPPASNGDRQHRSESPLPANAPSRAQVEQAIAAWHADSFYDGTTVKNVGIGPLRYGAITLLSPKKDLFVCTRLTAKNKFGTYTPEQKWFVPIYNNNRGVYAGFVSTG